MSNAAHSDHEVIETEPAAPVSGFRAGDPSCLGLMMFVPGGVSLGLALVGYTSDSAALGLNSGLDVFLFATGLGHLITCLWALALGQTAVAAVFGIFFGYWVTLGVQVTGLVHNWFGIQATDKVLQTYLIAFIVSFGVLTLGTLRLPLAFTVIFGLVVAALAFVLAGVSQASETMLNVGGYLVLVLTAAVIYVLVGALSLATGGKGLNLGKAIQS